MHTHNRIDSLSLFLCLHCSPSQQCSLGGWDEWETERQRQRDSRHKGDLLPHQAVHSMLPVRESVILAPAARCSLALIPPLSAREVWSDRPPDTRAAAPLAPLQMQCRPGAGCPCRRLQRRRMEGVWSKVACTGRPVGDSTTTKTDKEHFSLSRGLLQIRTVSVHTEI